MNEEKSIEDILTELEQTEPIHTQETKAVRNIDAPMEDPYSNIPITHHDDSGWFPTNTNVENLYRFDILQISNPKGQNAGYRDRLAVFFNTATITVVAAGIQEERIGVAVSMISLDDEAVFRTFDIGEVSLYSSGVWKTIGNFVVVVVPSVSPLGSSVVPAIFVADSNDRIVVKTISDDRKEKYFNVRSWEIFPVFLFPTDTEFNRQLDFLVENIKSVVHISQLAIGNKVKILYHFDRFWIGRIGTVKALFPEKEEVLVNLGRGGDNIISYATTFNIVNLQKIEGE